MPDGGLSAIASGIGIISGGNALLGDPLGLGPDQMDPAQAQRAANPLAPYQQGWAEQLNKLMADPSGIVNQPGYKFAQAEGEHGISEMLAARGLQNTGAEKIALKKFDEGFAGSWYDKMINQLSGLATGNAGAGATAAMNQGQSGLMNTYAGLGMMTQGIQGLSRIYPGSGGNTYSPQSQGAAAELFTQGWTPENYG